MWTQHSSPAAHQEWGLLISEAPRAQTVRRHSLSGTTYPASILSWCVHRSTVVCPGHLTCFTPVPGPVHIPLVRLSYPIKDTSSSHHVQGLPRSSPFSTETLILQLWIMPTTSMYYGCPSTQHQRLVWLSGTHRSGDQEMPGRGLIFD